ncbi:GIY-YIG nuclease family protein [Streptomyces sp. SID13726]|uniref:GIY-YIG nuclease family protein n=1 Tax=Streptomyces sp. SID13726 TaxID=2706058 RepID=UPI0013BCE303|nr:GIY-YIG nuclease family protein [Streptomyces sp. SID13726]NEB04088.1 GIY-YIG nuclease family protein [Streptomyces sp. SID13726]
MGDADARFLRGLFDEEGSLHAAGRTALYRLYGLEGLLYVGISTCPLTRVRTHLREQRWRSQVIGIRIDYPDDAEAAEREAVWSERPRYNVVFNGRRPPPPPDRAARLRAELAAERRRLAELEAAVPESAAHLRLITRGIRAKRARIARLAEAAEDASHRRTDRGGPATS